jgi:gluconate 2-dehydrogenase alpha chain
VTGQKYEQLADVAVLGAFTMTTTRLLLMAGIGTPYDASNGTGVVGKNFCYQTNSTVNVFKKE